MKDNALWPDEEYDDYENLPDSSSYRKKGRKQIFAVAIAALGILSVIYLSRANAGEQGLSSRDLQGKWSLLSVGKKRIGVLGILHQTITIQGERIVGVTHMLMNPPGEDARIPVPDQSVDRVVKSQDGMALTIYWSGVCRTLSGGRLEMKIGSAQYRINGKYSVKTGRLALDPDFLLTNPGSADYAPEIETENHTLFSDLSN